MSEIHPAKQYGKQLLSYQGFSLYIYGEMRAPRIYIFPPEGSLGYPAVESVGASINSDGSEAYSEIDRLIAAHQVPHEPTSEELENVHYPTQDAYVSPPTTENSNVEIPPPVQGLTTDAQTATPVVVSEPVPPPVEVQSTPVPKREKPVSFGWI
jgi:hypothetical protein